MEQPISIALADDHTVVRKGLVALLAGDERFRIVAEAGDGAELLKRIAALGKPPDICLLDMQMPVMNGHDTLIALKKLYPDLRALVLSQYDDDFAIIRMLRAGARGYLPKDADPEELKQAIVTVHANAYYHNRLVTRHIDAMVTRGYEKQQTLSATELTFLRYACTELSYNDIADKMGLSKSTVEACRERLCQKFGVNTRVGLALHALGMGMLPPG